MKTFDPSKMSHHERAEESVERRNLDDSSSFTGSIYTTTSSSTVLGPGATTGKFLKVVGEKSLDLVVGVVIRRRLSAVKRTLEKYPHILCNPSGEKEEKQMIGIYIDLHELCRESRSDYYSQSLQLEAAHLIWEITLITRNGEASRTNEQWEALVAHVQRREELVTQLQENVLRARSPRSFNPFMSFSSNTPSNRDSEEPVPYDDAQSNKQAPSPVLDHPLSTLSN